MSNDIELIQRTSRFLLHRNTVEDFRIMAVVSKTLSTDFIPDFYNPENRWCLYLLANKGRDKENDNRLYSKLKSIQTDEDGEWSLGDVPEDFDGFGNPVTLFKDEHFYENQVAIGYDYQHSCHDELYPNLKLENGYDRVPRLIMLEAEQLLKATHKYLGDDEK